MHRNSNADRFDRITSRTDPFISTDGRAFVHVPADSQGRRTFPIRSDEFRDWFFVQAYGVSNRIPTTYDFDTLCRHLEAEARRHEDAIGILVRRRVASPDNQIQIDLANSAGEFIAIDASGYRVDSGVAGVAFETAASAKSHPAPESPADGESPLDALRALLRLGPPASPAWLRILTWIFAALRDHGPFPILILRGPTGSGKSVTARLLRSLIDPCVSRFTPTPRTARELFTLARSHWVLAFDHVATLSPGVSDALCQLATGVAVAFPEHGRRDPVHEFLRRPILLTVTDRLTIPRELASHALVVDLPELTAETRRPEMDVVRAFADDLPKLLGALCAAISRALANGVKPIATATRHAEALSWICAVFPELTPQLCDAIDETSAPHPILAAVRDLLAENPKWTGSATDLVKRIRLGPNPRALSAYLRNHILELLDLGIDVNFGRLPGGDRVIDLFASQPPAPAYITSPNAVAPNLLPALPCAVYTPEPAALDDRSRI